MVGMDIWASASVNTVEAARKIFQFRNMGRSLQAEYKRPVAMPQAGSSGGYLMVGGWLQMMGEEAGWK